MKPRGDTEVMHRSTPNIGYKPTRFEGEWTPYGESSIDTALRRAVEKTTVEHTFHLPRGIRVKCAVKPLLPIALFGCANPDPPPAPVASKLYDRLHLAPANPVAAPTPVADTAPAPAPPLKLDNAAECAAPRLQIAQTRHRRLRQFTRRPRHQAHGCQRAISFIDPLPARLMRRGRGGLSPASPCLCESVGLPEQVADYTDVAELTAVEDSNSKNTMIEAANRAIVKASGVPDEVIQAELGQVYARATGA